MHSAALWVARWVDLLDAWTDVYLAARWDDSTVESMDAHSAP